jgi:hypothetical protein
MQQQRIGTSMLLSTQTLSAWTPGQSNPGVDLCLEGLGG